MDYCRYSAMPVGRFVLDVHGESRDIWPLNDALCAALQVINHLQDCAKDYRELDRVYIPLDMLAEQARSVDAGAGQGSAHSGLARRDRAHWRGRTRSCWRVARLSRRSIRDQRLALEVSVIQTLAEDLNASV